MRWADARFDNFIGYEPPIGLSPPSEQTPARSAALARWLAAVTLTGTMAAGLIASALHMAAGRAGRSVRTPVMVRSAAPPHPDVAGVRADRLEPRVATGLGSAEARVEQLSASGSDIAHFTHLVLDLARLANDPAPPPTLSDPSAASETPAPPEPETLLDQAERIPTAVIETKATGRAPAGETPDLTRVAKAVPDAATIEQVVSAKADDSLASVLRALGVAAADGDAIVAQFGDAPGGASAAFAGGEKIVVLESAAGGGDDAMRPLKVSVKQPRAAATAVVALSDGGRYLRAAPPRDEAGPNAGSAGPGGANDASAAAAASGASLRAALYGVVERSRLDRPLVDEFVRVCGHDFDLETTVSVGDEAEVLYRADAPDGPRLAFARLTAGGKTHRYYLFTAPDAQSADYYDDTGRSATPFLLRKPVAEGRLGDGFGWRVHPVLRDRRFHEGVDYAAPFGSPIVAAGAGVVEKIDTEWGYGKYIRIRHDWGYETTYAHVASFARGMTPGARVRQGQPIAYIGSTGLSTGPHLYYEVEINGRKVDPLRVKLAAGRRLDGDALAAFERRRDRIEGLLKASPVVASDAR